MKIPSTPLSGTSTSDSSLIYRAYLGVFAAGMLQLETGQDLSGDPLLEAMGTRRAMQIYKVELAAACDLVRTAKGKTRLDCHLRLSNEEATLAAFCYFYGAPHWEVSKDEKGLIYVSLVAGVELPPMLVCSISEAVQLMDAVNVGSCGEPSDADTKAFTAFSIGVIEFVGEREVSALLERTKKFGLATSKTGWTKIS